MMGKNLDSAGHHLSLGTNSQEIVTIYSLYYILTLNYLYHDLRSYNMRLFIHLTTSSKMKN